MKKDNGRYHIEAITQAGDVLAAVADSREPMSAAEIAKATGLNNNKAFRICSTLEAMNYLNKVGDRFKLGQALSLFWARYKTRREAERDKITQELKSLEIKEVDEDAT